MKICALINEDLLNSIENCQNRFTILPNAKKLFKNSQRRIKFSQSGEITPNLVTLTQSNDSNHRQHGQIPLPWLPQ